MAVLIAKTGTLAPPAAVGVSTNQVTVDNCNALAIAFVINAGNSVTNSIQLEQSLDAGANWIGPIFALNMATGTTVTTAVAASTTNTLFVVANPVGLYRANVTAFAAGTPTAIYKIGAGYQE